MAALPATARWWMRFLLHLSVIVMSNPLLRRRSTAPSWPTPLVTTTVTEKGRIKDGRSAKRVLLVDDHLHLLHFLERLEVVLHVKVVLPNGSLYESGLAIIV